MKLFLINNKEVYLVSYIIEAENANDALKRWETGMAEEVDMEFQAHLNEYTRFSIPDVTEVTNDELSE